MRTEFPAVIVGAGPAGVRAAYTLVKHGVATVVIDEAPRSGGQIYRQPPPLLSTPAKALYGFEARKAEALHLDFEEIKALVDYRPNELVWNACDQTLDLWNAATSRYSQQPWRDIILATGAIDRVLPVPGWTLPGVYSLGGAQIALKHQGCAIGRRVVLAGNGPLLYLVAYQYKKAGADVRAVLDHSGFASQLSALPRLCAMPRVLAKGLYYLAWLRLHGVVIHSGARLSSVDGEDCVERVCWEDCGDQNKRHSIECDALGFGYGLRSETQLADLLGCRFAFADEQRAFVPEQDHGQSSQPHVFLAGDGSRVMGADAAELAGEQAALRLLAARGVATDQQRLHRIGASLRRIGTFRSGIERAFPFPEDWAAHVADETVICRCEQLTAGELRAMIESNGIDEINRLKALSRVGMGRCQGRVCACAAAELLAASRCIPVDRVGRIRSQAPIKPIPISAQHVQEGGIDG